MPETKTFALRLDADVYKRIQKIAEKDAVSMNTWINQVLLEVAPHDQNDLFDAEFTIFGPTHPMAIRFADPTENLPEAISEALSFVLKEAEILNYWTSFNREQIEILVNFQKRITKNRDAYLTSRARVDSLSQKELNSDLGAQTKIMIEKEKIDRQKFILDQRDFIDELLKNMKAVSNRRNKQLASALSDSRTIIERISWDLDAIKRKIEEYQTPV